MNFRVGDVSLINLGAWWQKEGVMFGPWEEDHAFPLAVNEADSRLNRAAWRAVETRVAGLVMVVSFMIL